MSIVLTWWCKKILFILIFILPAGYVLHKTKYLIVDYFSPIIHMKFKLYMLKEGYFIPRHDKYGQTLRSRGFVGVESWITANLQRLTLGSNGPLLRDELNRSNRELRDVLSFGGIVTYDGDILAIGLENVVDEEFMSILREKGVIKCTVLKTEKLLGADFNANVPIRRQTKINFYAPQLDSRLSYSTSKGNSFFFCLDREKSLHHEFIPFEKHIGGAIYGIKLPKDISISTGTFLSQVLAEACMEKGFGYVPQHCVKR